jgi:hypothetical protein
MAKSSHYLTTHCSMIVFLQISNSRFRERIAADEPGTRLHLRASELATELTIFTSGSAVRLSPSQLFSESRVTFAVAQTVTVTLESRTSRQLHVCICHHLSPCSRTSAQLPGSSGWLPSAKLDCSLPPSRVYFPLSLRGRGLPLTPSALYPLPSTLYPLPSTLYPLHCSRCYMTLSTTGRL